MSIKKQDIHAELKTALSLEGISLSAFAKNIKKPNGDVGITHTALIRVAQHHEDTPWIRRLIKNLIQESRSTYPEYWKIKDASR